MSTYIGNTYYFLDKKILKPEHPSILKLRSPVQDLSNFQMAPVPFLSDLTCSTHSPHDILKVWKKNTITCLLGMSNMTSVFLAGVVMGFVSFWLVLRFVCPRLLVLLHIIWSICICHGYTHVIDCLPSLIDCRHLTNDTIRALHLAVIRCSGLAFTCGVKMIRLCQGWGWQPPQTASHIHIGDIQSDLAH